ncbi:MAG: UvrD-helicase domain-containing protein [Candidatus Nealsonbacteria bacterium]|nr:UvrD-helicase domain-containing protein [Candidatus Nealsonbacteria bacterium]
MAIELEKLNSEQKIAVTHGEGPLLIVAGAGTGKTAVITQRIAHLIEQSKAKPEEILALTFTEKAAGEMEERVDALLPIGYIDLWISTFHAFCERILRDYALEIGLPSDFKIIDQTAAWLLVYKNFDRLDLKYYKPLGNPSKFIHALLSHFSHCKDQEIYPENYLKYAEMLKTRDDAPESQEIERIKEVAIAYHVYQRLLLENSELDFGDLINYCLKVFQERPLILKKYREKFKYVLVDEFQDTNWAQYELIKKIAAPKNNLTVCADDDQAIYRWRGASFSNIVQFKNDFPAAREISLIKNYRSCQDILDLSYNFIKGNDPDRLECISQISKKLQAAAEFAKAEIEHIHAKTLEEEINLVVRKILELLKKDKKASLGDFCILVRANNSANPFTKALERAGLPYQFLASRGLYAKHSVLDVISYLKLLDNYHESSALFRIFSLPFLGISPEDVMLLTHYASKKTKSLFESAKDLALIPGVSQNGREKINFILGLIQKHAAMSRQKPVSEIMVQFLDDSGYLKHLVRGGEEEQLDLLNQFFRKVKAFENSSPETTLNIFMQEIKLELESGEEGKINVDPEQGPDVIKVMTVHGAKGLEFKYVFLVNMVDKRFPSIERSDPIELPDELIKDIRPGGDVHLQEERRICYVAMTRAKNGLYLTSAQDYGGSRSKKLSRFLIEMGYRDKLQATNSKTKNEMLEPKYKIKNKPHATKYLPGHFSYSQLAAFEKCPLQYKFNFVLKVPVRGRGAFSFGKTIHNTFYRFLARANEIDEKKQGDLFGMAPAQSAAGFEALNQIYENNWIDEWYENKKQKEDYRKLGKKIIKEFYADFIEAPPKILKIDGVPALEAPFNLKVEGHTVKGKIDRIDETADGVLLIDYKTGSARDKISAEEKEQLLIYQLAAEDVFGLRPTGLVYHYLEENKKIAFVGSEQDRVKIKEKIAKTIEAIKASDFAPTPGWQCSFCDFKDICEYSKD